MTDNDIVNALTEWSELGMTFCNIGMNEFARNILSLIKRLQAEIEALTNAVDKGIEVCHECHGKYVVRIEKAKTEAIKEFAERMKADKIKPEFPWDDFYVTESTIDNLVKEMTEDGLDDRS